MIFPTKDIPGWQEAEVYCSINPASLCILPSIYISARPPLTVNPMCTFVYFSKDKNIFLNGRAMSIGIQRGNI